MCARWVQFHEQNWVRSCERRGIERGVAIGHFDMPPSLQWSEQHEQIGGTIALILVVVAGWLAWLRLHWDTGFLDELLGRLVQADDGSVSGSYGLW
jgi:hypothetical protein